MRLARFHRLHLPRVLRRSRLEARGRRAGGPQPEDEFVLLLRDPRVAPRRLDPLPEVLHLQVLPAPLRLQLQEDRSRSREDQGEEDLPDVPQAKAADLQPEEEAQYVLPSPLHS